MAEFQWWLLIVGLVAGGGLVFVVSMDSRRRDEDIQGLERQAEATWIADQLAARDREPMLDPQAVEAVLRVHREYLSLPPPDRLVLDGDDFMEPERESYRDPDLSDRDADRSSHDVGDDRRGRADEDLAAAAEQQAPAREEAHAGADREQRRD
jgi:hypothetical protein